MNIFQLKYAYENKIPLVWKNPNPIEGNDYTISFINFEGINSDFWNDPYTIVLIQYANGGSEVEAFLSEIEYKDIYHKDFNYLLGYETPDGISLRRWKSDNTLFFTNNEEEAKNDAKNLGGFYKKVSEFPQEIQDEYVRTIDKIIALAERKIL